MAEAMLSSKPTRSKGPPMGEYFKPLVSRFGKMSHKELIIHAVRRLDEMDAYIKQLEHNTVPADIDPNLIELPLMRLPDLMCYEDDTFSDPDPLSDTTPSPFPTLSSYSLLT